jgi:hypothetical protein
MPTTLEGYYGEGYGEAERLFRQKEPDNYKLETISTDWLGPALGDKIDEATGTKRVFYRAAVVDGVTIKVGEYVLIREDCKSDDGEEANGKGKDVDGKESDRNQVGSTMYIDQDNTDDEDTIDGIEDMDIEIGGDVSGRTIAKVSDNRSRESLDLDNDGSTLEGTDDGLGGKVDDKGTWFGQVMYFYEDDGHKKAHVRYFSPGSQTILMEQSSWQELFLLDNCDEVDLDSVMGKFKSRRIKSTAELEEEDTYFYR